LESVEKQSVTYVTTKAAYSVDVPGSEVFVVTDANRNHPMKLIQTAVEILFQVVRSRPDWNS